MNDIEANPVRTDLVENPEDWRWSSARARRCQDGLMPDDFDIPVLMKQEYLHQVQFHRQV
jgi:hypothetical protein